MKVRRSTPWVLPWLTCGPILKFTDRFELERICWDPKDSELCLHRVKPEEILVEARSDQFRSESDFA